MIGSEFYQRLKKKYLSKHIELYTQIVICHRQLSFIHAGLRALLEGNDMSSMEDEDEEKESEEEDEPKVPRTVQILLNVAMQIIERNKMAKEQQQV